MTRHWQDDAACLGMDTELWFPPGQALSAAAVLGVRKAKEVCESCPVCLECLTFATRTGQRGIWGGLTEEQRRRSKLCRGLRAEVLAS